MISFIKRDNDNAKSKAKGVQNSFGDRETNKTKMFALLCHQMNFGVLLSTKD